MAFSIEDQDDLTRFIENIKGGATIEVGVWGSMAKIAAVHEFGSVIKPKKGKYLTIPVHKAAKGKRVSDFPGLIRNRKKGGSLGKLLGMREGGKFVPYFVLTESVTIPERSFLRATLDEEMDNIVEKLTDVTMDAGANGVPLQTVAETIALELRGKVQNKVRNLKTPSNTPLTANMKGSNNPLVDSGSLLRAIDYKVKGGGVE